MIKISNTVMFKLNQNNNITIVFTANKPESHVTWISSIIPPIKVNYQIINSSWWYLNYYKKKLINYTGCHKFVSEYGDLENGKKLCHFL